MSFEPKERYGFSDLVAIMALLREPGGCPWDREQTHESIRKNFLEETYEVLDAIDRSDDKALEEELGDALLQVIFHARMAEERGAFDIEDCIDGIVKKLVFRHPLIFSPKSDENTTSAALDNWEALKNQEKGQERLEDRLNAVPRNFPALMRSQKLLKRAIKGEAVSGDPDSAASAAEEAFNVYRKAPDSNTLGRLLFMLCRDAQIRELDAEEALDHVNQAFTEKRGQHE